MNTQRINNASNLCEDSETKGFDLEAGQSWIYPTNYPVRDYQYNITQEALHKNTLVSLPTGLGKTFIAAVVMYNFYRWYPHGKIVFMAPTRPLVEQQIDACYNIMAIPQEVTAELTGVKKVQASRAEIWQSKRVFFVTPQILQNDLESVSDLGGKIRCLVFDEAHKAKGGYAYCEVIKKLLMQNKLFRVLALSATPGNSVKDVLEVMQNLLIAHLEFRNEESPDVKPYVFERSLETVVVPLGEKLQQVKDDYEKILEKYARTLIQYKVIYGNFSNLTKGKIFMVMKEFQAKNRSSGTPNYSEIMKTLNICVTLYHAYEALVRCGLRVFSSFYEEHIKNPLLSGNTALIKILEDLRDYLGPAPNVELLPDGSYSEVSASTKFGHPKFYQLRDILLSHFANSDTSSRVIVFFEYRESVKEAYAILSQNRPSIKPRIFVGQGAGVKQKDQISTIKAFRVGSCNTLLSTCIGEEGLDVGEVNLIVCFDITNKSPIRMIQRMGRTGRKKEGRIIALVTEGKEQQTLKDCLVYKNNLGISMGNSQQLNAGKYEDNPKMIPSYIQPKCQKMFITVKKTVLTKKSNLKEMLRSLSFDGPKFADDIEIIEIKERLKNKTEHFWNKANPLEFNFEKSQINFSKHLEKQRAFQAGGEIKHSKQTDILVTLLQSADSKRFNIPVTQNFGKFSHLTENKNLKQGDIRTMFSKSSTAAVIEDPYVPISQIYNFDKEKDITQSFPSELFREISNFLSIQTSVEDSCKICAELFKCPKFCYDKSDPVDLSSWVQPDLSILDSITARDLEVFADSLSPKSRELYDSLETDNEIFDDIEFDDVGLEEPSIIKEKSFAFETPKGLEKILNSFRIGEDVYSEEKPKKVEEKSFAYETPKSFGKILKSFSMCEQTPVSTQIRKQRLETSPLKKDDKQEGTFNYNEILAFFKLLSIKDIFENESDEDLDKTIVYTPEIKTRTSSITPDMFEESPDLFPSSDEKQKIPVIEDPQSPVLCSYKSIQKSSAKKKLFDTPKNEEVAKRPNLAKLKLPHKSFLESENNSKKMRLQSPKSSPSALDISDICDLSDFGLDNKKDENREDKITSPNLDISDICDLSIFGLSKNDKTSIVEGKNTVKETKLVKENEEKVLNIEDICDMSAFFDEPVEVKSKSKIDTKSKEQISDISDFCDLSSFINTEISSLSKKSDDNLKISVIDLTDSDFESSPVKNKTQPAAKKVQSQLSITQVLSMVAKTSDNSQKENSSSTPKTTKGNQKSLLSLNNNKKKGILQLKQNLDSPKSTQAQKRKINTPKRQFNTSLTSNSDDEFEEPTSSPIFAKPKPITASSSVKKSRVKKPERTKKLFCEFLDEEAVLTENDKVPVSEDEDSGEDCFEASFVADETQDILNTTATHAEYLKTIRSPSVRGRFKIPRQPRLNITNVFSQAVDNEDNTYINDSFCVNTEDVDSPNELEISELEILEMKLKKMKKSKKRKSDEKVPTINTKRRRVVVISDDSD